MGLGSKNVTTLNGEDMRSAETNDQQPVQEAMIPEMVSAHRVLPSLERQEFIQGLFEELDGQLHRHLAAVAQLSRLQGRIDVSERALVATRDHLLSALESTVEESVPEGWQEVLDRVRFIGARIGVACAYLLERHGPLTMAELHARLNDGQFRFRTSTPLREINAALIRNSRARKDGEQWSYVPPEEEAVAS